MTIMRSAELAELVRDTYLHDDVNYTKYLSLEKLSGEEVRLESLFPEDVIAKIKTHLEGRISSKTELEFSGGFDFEKNNRDVGQIKYGQDLVVQRVGEIGRKRAIVSLGIGDGETSSRYAKESSELIGVDLHENYLDEAGRLIPGMKKIAFDLNGLSAQKVPIKDNHADIVECTMTAHHIEDFALFIREVSRILKPGGMFFYLDLIDKTSPEKEMIFHEHHRYPGFHRIEFFRSAEEVKHMVSSYLALKEYIRVGPGLMFLSAGK
jgi:ubiquinone/menaquinone biosynthesis C-methylase UbiE